MSDRNLSPNRKAVSAKRKFVVILIYVLIIGGGIWLWDEEIKDRIIPKRFGVVQEGLIYRSGRISASLIEKTLVKYNIHVIIDLTSDSPGSVDQQAEKRAAAKLNIDRLVFPLRSNGTGDINNYTNAVTAIVQANRENKAVLVHCAAGAQRTGGVIATYRLLVQRKDPAFVLKELKHYGGSNRNPKLIKYLNSNMEKFAKSLQQKNIIDQIPSPLPQLHQ
jgi:protein tyrosine/serine phosphatase